MPLVFVISKMSLHPKDPSIWQLVLWRGNPSEERVERKEGKNEGFHRPLLFELSLIISNYLFKIYRVVQICLDDDSLIPFVPLLSTFRWVPPWLSLVLLISRLSFFILKAEVERFGSTLWLYIWAEDANNDSMSYLPVSEAVLSSKYLTISSYCLFPLF